MPYLQTFSAKIFEFYILLNKIIVTKNEAYKNQKVSFKFLSKCNMNGLRVIDHDSLVTQTLIVTINRRMKKKQKQSEKVVVVRKRIKMNF